jgi:hypothetical protein
MFRPDQTTSASSPARLHEMEQSDLPDPRWIAFTHFRTNLAPEGGVILTTHIIGEIVRPPRIPIPKSVYLFRTSLSL